jgi:hypothetical protein
MTPSTNTTRIALPAVLADASQEIIAKASRHLSRIWNWLQGQQESPATGQTLSLEGAGSLPQVVKPSRNEERSRTAAPSLPLNAFQDLLTKTAQQLSRIWHWFQQRQKDRAAGRSLRLEDTVSLGQKRFVAVVSVDGQRFLIGVGTSEISMLAPLQEETSFSQVLQEKTAVGKAKSAVPARRKAKEIGAKACA